MRVEEDHEDSLVERYKLNCNACRETIPYVNNVCSRPNLVLPFHSASPSPASKVMQ